MAFPVTRNILAARTFVRPAGMLNATASSSRYISTTPPKLNKLARSKTTLLSDLPVPFHNVKPLEFPPLTPLPQTHGVHVATLRLQAHHPQNLDIVATFAIHSAHSLGIPTGLPAFLPRERSLFTVLKSPFVNKKAQENFERRTHKRSIRVYDATNEAVDLWLRYISLNSLPGVDLKAYVHEYVEYGFGKKEAEGLNEIESEVSEKRIQDAANALIQDLTEAEEVKTEVQGAEGNEKVEEAAKEQPTDASKEKVDEPSSS